MRSLLIDAFRTVAAVCEDVNELTKGRVRRILLLVRRGGRDIKQNGAMPPCWSGRVGRSQIQLLASDHPVCASFGGFAAFSLARSHPSSRGGEFCSLKHIGQFIHSS